jgi:hypothetical protein
MVDDPVEYRCPHGVVFARRSESGAYFRSAAERVCTACAIKTIFSVGPNEMFPRVPDPPPAPLVADPELVTDLIGPGTAGKRHAD